MNQLVKDTLAAGSNHDDLDGIDAAALATAIDRYHSAALLDVEATRARATKLMAKHHALARRLIDRQDDYLRFTTDPQVPFDNNATRSSPKRSAPGYESGPSSRPRSRSPARSRPTPRTAE